MCTSVTCDLFWPGNQVKEETGLMEVLDAEKNEILDAKRKIEQRYELTLTRLECISAAL